MGQPLAYFAVYAGAATASEKTQDLLYLLRPHLPQGFEDAVVAGLLTRLWDRAAQVGEDDGSVGDVGAKRLARILGWPGDHDVLVAALLEARFIAEVEGADGVISYQVHNWAKRQPALQKRLRDRARKRGERRTSEACPPDIDACPPDIRPSRREKTAIPDRERERERDQIRDQRSEISSTPGGGPGEAPSGDASVAPAPSAGGDQAGLALGGPDEDAVRAICAVEFRRRAADGSPERTWRPTAELARKWQKAHGGRIDVLYEVQKAALWLDENPSKVKEQPARYAGGWLRRARPDDQTAGYAALIRGEAPPAQAPDPWQQVVEAIRRTPPTEQLDLPKDVLRALGSIGGRGVIGQARPEAHAPIRRRFYEALALARRPAGGQVQRKGQAWPLGGGR